MTSGSMCRVCLVGNIRLLNLSAIHREVYEKLTNTELNAEIEYGMPSTVCYICHRQLQRCHAFSEMARKSNRILQEVLHNSTQVSHRAERIQHVQVMPTLTLSRTHHTSVDNAGYAEVEVVVKEERLLAVDDEPVEHLDIDIEECKLEPPDIKVEIEDDAIETKPMLERDMRPNYKRSCFYCDVCNKEMCRKSDLVKHILKFHNGKNPYSCAECDKIYSSKSALTKHERVHSGEKPYSCNICCKTFVVQDSLTRHMLIHTGEKPFSCNRCNNTFTFKTNLARHMRGHTGEKPYSCTECGKIFTENGSLTKHMRVHTGEKPYSCNKCHQTFTQKGNVKRHMRIHTGEKPYSCSKCDKIFTDKGNLTRHLRVHISSNFETSPPMLVHIDATDGTPVPNTI